MSKSSGTGFLRQAWRRKAKLKLGDQNLTKKQRFEKARQADLKALEFEVACG